MKRGGKTVYYWVCGAAARRRGYPVKTVRLWSGVGTPTDEELRSMSEYCKRLQYEKNDWGHRIRASKKSRSYATNGNIYFIGHDDSIKIGFAVNVQRRLSTIQSSTPQKLKLLHSMPGTPLDELKLHRKFEPLKIRGEWFQAAAFLLSYIEGLKSSENGVRTKAGHSS
jgi:hypothetical protein